MMRRDAQSSLLAGRWQAIIAGTLLVLASATTTTAQTGGRNAQRQGPRPAQPAREPRRAAPPLPGPERVRLVFNGGVQIASGAFGQDFTVTKNVESTPISADLTRPPAGFVDAGARVRVTRVLSIGAMGFFGSSKVEGTVNAQIPHPFYFNQRRPISGDLSGLTHVERGVHVELAYPLVVSAKREVTVFGGPSYISTRQELVTDVTYSESYPYDTATFTSAATTEVTRGALGANVGADVTWRLGRSVRAGALVRYTFANVSLDAATGNTADVHVGGLQIAGGLRFLIHKRPPRPTPTPQPPRPRR